MMFYTEPHHLQRGAGVFNVDRYPLQRGRGLGGVFANLLRKILPFGKTFFKAATSSGKKILQSELGRDILNDTISTAPKWVPIWGPGSPWGPFSVFGSPLGPHWIPLGPHFLF